MQLGLWGLGHAGPCLSEGFMFKKNTGGVKVHTSTYSRQGSGHPREKAIPSALVYGLNPRRSWEPAELVIGCRYQCPLRRWLCLKTCWKMSSWSLCSLKLPLKSVDDLLFWGIEWELAKVKDLKLVCLTKCLSCEALQACYRSERPDVAFILWPRDVEIYKHLKSCLQFVLIFNKLACKKLALK